MTKKGVMVFFFFFFIQKNSLFQLLPTFSCGALMHDQRKLSIYRATFCERYWYTLYNTQNKHLIALECFLTNAANHGLTDTPFTFIVIV